VAIVGGGIAGLSAAWWLQKHGLTDYILLELEPQLGGNSSYGQNSVSAYPWGAHYLPVPNADAVHVNMLLEELGVITGYRNGIPVFDDYHVCHDPEERLFIRGRWQEGLLPKVGATREDLQQYDRFFAQMEAYRTARGRDGRPAFALPLDGSSRDEAYLTLDAMSMAEWLQANNYTSEKLLWYVNYACRDDYGSTLANTSAWAGIHYFAARRSQGLGADGLPLQGGAVLTWPQGNGWLVQQMQQRLCGTLCNSAAVVSIRQEGNVACIVDYLDTATDTMRRILAGHVIFAAPQFIAQHIVQGYAEAAQPFLREAQYAPWLVTNLTLRQLPDDGRGEPLCWDNVPYDSPSLGYVVATHQGLGTTLGKTVVTHYHPLADRPAAQARAWAYKQPAASWVQQVLADMEKMHPGISADVEAADLCLWGHGMITPHPGFVWGRNGNSARQAAQQPFGRVHFAHSDLSGISIFEEAQYQGIRAATQVLHERRIA
jgi:protoporphyrinogen oxidase